jgi:hypothetical protein
MTAVTDMADRIARAFKGDGASALAACFSDDGRQVHPFLGVQNGRAEIEAAEGVMFAAFADVDFTVENVVDGGDWGALEFTVSATHTAPLTMPDGTEVPATGTRVTLSGCEVFRLGENGLIAEAHRYEDGLAFMGQLGLLG